MDTAEKDIDDILLEDSRRMQAMFSPREQITGKGLPRHDNRCTLEGHPIRSQWLTDETYHHQLYKDVRRHHGLTGYCSWFNNKYGGVAEPLTEAALSEELLRVRISTDPYFAFAICFRIKDKASGAMVPFILNYAQVIMLEMLEGMRLQGQPIRIILLKARQWGGSTLVQLYIDWIQMFVRSGWNSIILAQTKDTSRRIKAMYRKVVENLPDFVFGTPDLKFSPYEGSQSDFTLTTKARKPVRDNVTTVASYENYESARGADYAMAHYSEVAFWRTTPSKSAEGLITNISGGILPIAYTIEVLESTANGQAGYYYVEYQLAKQKKSSRSCLFIPFFYIEHDRLQFKDDAERREFAAALYNNRISTYEDETHDSGRYNWSLWLKGATLEHLKWYMAKRPDFHDHASMAQEAPSDDVECFKFSGMHVFNPYRVEELRNKYKREPIMKGDVVLENGTPCFVENPTGELWIWKRAEKSDLKDDYLVVVDVGGRSSSSDPSCITVINRKPLMFSGGKPEVVARWHGRLRYDLMAWKAVYIAMLYNNALLAFESNTMDRKKAEAGEFVEQGDHIRGILQVVADSYKHLYMRAATDPEDIKKGILHKIGFHTNVKTKQDMVDAFIVQFEDDKWIDPDERLYDEAAIYEQFPDGHYGNHEGRGNHDDILMTDMIATMISKEMKLPRQRTLQHDDDYEMGTPNESKF